MQAANTEVTPFQQFLSLRVPTNHAPQIAKAAQAGGVNTMDFLSLVRLANMANNS